MTDGKPLFMYGSGVQPASMIRDSEAMEEFEEIYAREFEFDEDVGENPEVKSDAAVERWEKQKDRLIPVPVKVPGLRRSYTHEHRGAAMLDAIHTGDKEDWINGVLWYGLKEQEREDLRDTEEGYEMVEIEGENIEPYISDELMMEMGVKLPDKLEIFIPSTASGDEMPDTEKPRHETYHRRIMQGITDQLGELYGEKFVEQFIRDFYSTTTSYNPVADELQQTGFKDNYRRFFD